MEQIPFIQEQYYLNMNKFKTKRNMFLNFKNNIIYYFFIETSLGKAGTKLAIMNNSTFKAKRSIFYR